MNKKQLLQADGRILADLYLSRGGADLVEALVDRFGARFGATEQERAAGDYLTEHMRGLGLDKVWQEEYECTGWIRKETRLRAISPAERDLDCIALPYCPPGDVQAKLVSLGDGNPQTYAENRERLRGAIAMVTTATPRFYHRAMHRGEKLGRALEAGAVGFIWMRGEPGGLPETGAARFNRACEVPAISVSYETGHELLRMGRQGDVVLKIESTNAVQESISHNVVGEITGRTKPGEVVVVGGHYDGHDISHAANDNGAGTAVAMEAARALAPLKDGIARTIRFVAFAGEEIGLIGSEEYVRRHRDENTVFMLNLDGAGRGTKGALVLQNCPEGVGWFSKLLREMYESQVAVGDQVNMYSDMYHFAAEGRPAAHYASAEPVSGGAPRGFGHTFWDSLDKLNPKALQADAIFVARLILRIATLDQLPLRRKTAADFAARLKEMGYDQVLRYEKRPVPGEQGRPR